MRRTLRDETGEVGALDASAIVQVSDEAWPLVRDAEELHDALLTLVVLPAVPAWAQLFADLAAAAARHRAADRERITLWVAAERLSAARALLPGARPDPPLSTGRHGRTAANAPARDRESAATELLRGWLESTGPTTAAELASRLSVDRRDRRHWPRSTGIRGTSPARPLPAGRHATERRPGVVQPPPARADSPAHHRAAAPRDRAGDIGRVPALSLPLAAPGARHPAARRRGHSRGAPATPGIRGTRRRVGERRAVAPSGRLLARVPRSAVPLGRSDVGPPLAASRVRPRGGRARPGTRARSHPPDARRPYRDLPERRGGLADRRRGTGRTPGACARAPLGVRLPRSRCAGTQGRLLRGRSWRR